MNTPINKPPKSKVVKVIKENDNIILLQKQTLKSKWPFFTIEHKKDKISRQMNKLRTVAEQIAMREKLIHSTSMDNYLLSNRSISTSADNGRVIQKKK